MTYIDKIICNASEKHITKINWEIDKKLFISQPSLLPRFIWKLIFAKFCKIQHDSVNLFDFDNEIKTKIFYDKKKIIIISAIFDCLLSIVISILGSILFINIFNFILTKI